MSIAYLHPSPFFLFRDGDERAWIVDIGDIEPVLAFLKEKGLTIEGVLVTHAHFDHIHGQPELAKAFPECKVSVSEYAKQGLASDKLNMSPYHETPLTYEGDNVTIVRNGDCIF